MGNIYKSLGQNLVMVFKKLELLQKRLNMLEGGDIEIRLSQNHPLREEIKAMFEKRNAFKRILEVS